MHLCDDMHRKCENLCICAMICIENAKIYAKGSG
jgi:hypothetical protein